MDFKMTARALLLVTVPGLAKALDNGVGITPAMGFNTYQSPWSFQGGDALVIAAALDATGLHAAGYNYVNSDAGWQPNKGGRNASGSPVPDMTSTATQLAAKGFRMGLYSALSSVQCGMAPGGLYHEDLDAQAYGAWGLAYLKYDNCAEYALEPNARSSPMRDALNRTGGRTGKPVLYSTEPFHLTPNPQAHISNLWRTTTDVAATTAKVRVNLDLNDKWAEFAGPGAFNDPDMLQVGKGKSTTLNEHRTNFMMWAVAKSPLLLSTNLTALAEQWPSLLALLANGEVIAVNQDSDGVQARKLEVDGKPVGLPVGVEECARPDMMALAAATTASAVGGVFGSMPEAEAGKQLWSAVPVPGGDAVQLRHGFYAGRCLALQSPNPIAYNPPYRHPSRPNPRPVWSSSWQAVLLPCDPTAAIQKWRFVAPGEFPSETAAHFARQTLSAVVNVAAAAANNTTHPGPFPNATGPIALSLLPETDARYGVNHVGGAALQYSDAEVACVDRDCTQYQPSQMWYLDRFTGQLQSGNYTASINEQWLTSMVPAPSRRCLAAVHSADMAGTPAGGTEAWGGPLTNGSLVVALSNRDAPDGTTVEVAVKSLLEPNGFFSFAMLAPAAARASGYARSVSLPATLATLAPSAVYAVRDILAKRDLPGHVSAATGVVRATVDQGDTKLFVLAPVAAGGEESER